MNPRPFDKEFWNICFATFISEYFTDPKAIVVHMPMAWENYEGSEVYGVTQLFDTVDLMALEINYRDPYCRTLVQFTPLVMQAPAFSDVS